MTQFHDKDDIMVGDYDLRGNQMRNPRTLIPALFACILWGSAFPTLKTMYDVMGVGTDVGIKIQLAGIRFTIAGAMILLYFALRYRKLPVMPDGRSWLQVGILGLFQTSLMYGFYYVSIYNTTGVKASILSQASIFIVVILSHFVYHDDKMHRGKWIGLIMGLMGILVVNVSGLGGQSFFTFTLMGEGLLLISNLFSAFSTFYVKRLGKTIDPVLLNGWQILSGGMLLLVIGSLTATETLDFSHNISVPLMVYSALISSGAFTIWYQLLQKNKASEMAMLRFSIPVFGSVMSALLLPGEGFTVFILVSLLLVAMGIYQCYRPRSL